MAYDIIGDIHGHADKLVALLGKLGYSKSGGCYRHAGRTAIFVGDFIDRGRGQLRTLDIVQRMIGEGSALAVMGNHELNAIAWHTPRPDMPEEYLRPRNHPTHGEKNRKQHEAFLYEVEHDPVRHKQIVDWFLTLPLWLDLDGVRVVHACWHAPFMEWLSPCLRDGRYLTPDLMPKASIEPEDEQEKDNAVPSVFKAVEALTKGLEVPLPEGHSFLDKDGHRRHRVRIRWWDRSAETYRKAAMIPEEKRENLPDDPIPGHARSAHPTDKPIFFGHYWFTGDPSVLPENAVCVDYSAGKGGPLVAYRWDGEAVPNSAKFVRAGG